MNIQDVFRGIEQGKCYRLPQWSPGECVGQDEDGLFYRCGHSETYNHPSVTTNWRIFKEEILSNNWEEITVLEPHGYLLICRRDNKIINFVWEKQPDDENYYYHKITGDKLLQRRKLYEYGKTFDPNS